MLNSKIQIDQNKCIGCGRCTELCSSVFELNENGKSEVISEENINCAMSAADQCPVEAIIIND